jgi:putative endonuclease
MAIQKHTTQKLGIKAKTKAKTDKRQRGDFAEDLALAYLQEKGFSLVTRNFNCRLGELDLIMLDDDFLVFVEVRHRKTSHFGGALESITPSKQAKLRRAAEVYLQTTKTPDCPCRFDILCLTGNIQQPEYQWITNAF